MGGKVKMIISIITIFIISFLLLFIFIYKGNKNESETEKISSFLVIVVAGLLALAPTAVITVILFVLLGSTTAINMMFTLEIDMKQLILLAVFLLIYLFSIDSIIESVIKYIVRVNIFFYIILLLIRILVIYIIGLALGLDQTTSFIIASGVSLIVLILEVLYHLNEKNKEASSE